MGHHATYQVPGQLEIGDGIQKKPKSGVGIRGGITGRSTDEHPATSSHPGWEPLDFSRSTNCRDGQSSGYYKPFRCDGVFPFSLKRGLVCDFEWFALFNGVNVLQTKLIKALLHLLQWGSIGLSRDGVRQINQWKWLPIASNWISNSANLWRISCLILILQWKKKTSFGTVDPECRCSIR